MASSTKRWVLFTGVMTWMGLRVRTMAFFGQFLAQTPQPRQMDSSITGRFSFMEMALIGQTFAHFPQLTQLSPLIFGM